MSRRVRGRKGEPRCAQFWKPKLRSLAVILVVASGLGGCGQANVPEERFYRLEVPVHSTAGVVRLPGVLVVQRFTADGLTAQRPLVYGTLDAPHELRQYNYHFWADTPTRMLQELTVDVLRGAGLANQVLTPELRALADYELTGKIKRLEHLRGEASMVTVRLELALSRIDGNQLVWLEDLSAEHPTEDDSVASATRAMGGALSEIYQAALRGLAELPVQ